MDSGIPTVGAVLIIVSLGINAFTQQALRSVPCQVDDPGQQASISIAQTALGGTYRAIFSAQGGKGGAMATVLDVAMKAAFITGLADVESASLPLFTCASGNCSFPVYGGITHSTITFEIECVDISPLIVQVDYEYGSANYTNYTIPDGPTLTYTWASQRVPMDTEWDIPLQWYPYYNATASSWYGSQVNFTYPRGASFFFMTPTTSTCEDLSKFPNYREGAPPLPRVNASSCSSSTYTEKVSTLPGFYGLTAGACNLYPTLQRYHGVVTEGQLSEHSVLSQPILLQTAEEDPNFFIDDAEGVGREPYFWTLLDPCFIDGIGYTSSNLSAAPGRLVDIKDGNNTLHTGPEECLYGLSYFWYFGLEQLVDELLMDESCGATANETAIVCDKWWLNSLWNERNSSFASIQTAFDRAAKSMTNRLRAIGTDWQGARTLVPGTVLQTAICVEVEWQWLFFPGTIALATTIMFVAVIVKSVQMADKWGVWKSSVLPFLIYGVEEEAKTPGHTGESGIKEHAKATSVSFKANGDGWRVQLLRDENKS